MEKALVLVPYIIPNMSQSGGFLVEDTQSQSEQGRYQKSKFCARYLRKGIKPSPSKAVSRLCVLMKVCFLLRIKTHQLFSFLFQCC